MMKPAIAISIGVLIGDDNDDDAARWTSMRSARSHSSTSTGCRRPPRVPLPNRRRQFRTVRGVTPISRANAAIEIERASNARR
jgi:hypothetical protein